MGDDSLFREKAMLKRIPLIAAIFATVSLPATEALARRGGGFHGGYRGGYHGGYRTGHYHGYRGGYYRPGYGVGAAAAGAAVGAAAAGAAAAGAYGNSCWQWNGYNWVWAC